MDGRFNKKSSLHRWIIFVCGVLCIAAIGISSHFFELHRKEKERRFAAENRLKDLTSQLQLLRERNRELAEQLREAKRIAEEFAREKEEAKTVVSEIPPGVELPEVEPSPEKTVVPEQAKGVRLVEALRAFPLQQMSLAASKISSGAGERWREFRTAFSGSIRSAKLESDPVSASQPSQLLDAIKRFPVARLVRTATEAQSSAREALGELREQFASRVAPSKPSESPEVAPPSEASKKLTATNEELRQELAEVRREKRELEWRIAERTGKIPGSVNVGQVRITTGRRFSGRVLVVNPKHNFVIIDIGKIHGLEKGVVLIVHRGSKFIGKVQVIKVYEKMAAADLAADWMQDDVQVSDGVKKF
jgi:hypothetical protein